MAIASGTCPSCGAPIEFGLGSSIAKVCEYCRATVCRTDRGLENLGTVAELANVPSLVAVGDEGKADGRSFRVLGRVQLDHGKGPWDEFYVALDEGSVWGWLAYAEGHWLLTLPRPELSAPPREGLRLEQALELEGVHYVVTELKSARVVSAQGELPAPIRPGEVRVYADLLGRDRSCATIDYGSNQGAEPAEVFIGRVINERQLVVLQAGPRPTQHVQTDHLHCPNCGGDIPKLGAEHGRRFGCPYCGALTDITLQQVISQQDVARNAPDIPLGSRGAIDDVEYVCLAFLKRSALFDGERFGWDEYLLFSPGVGFRWLVKDESAWLLAASVNPADIDFSRSPQGVKFGQYTFDLRSSQQSRVDYVLGEVYWQVEVGETVQASDYVSGRQVLSREQGPDEVRWSYSAPLPWTVIAGAFGLSTHGSGVDSSDATPRASVGSVIAVLGVVLLVLACCVIVSSPLTGGRGGSGSGVLIFGGSGGYYGGK